jgi:NAD-dependent deacetylase
MEAGIARAARLFDNTLEQGGQLVVLTGAGISAESGIPTFRGPEGYWRIGSRNHRPEELATLAAFTRMPAEIWGWYLYRRGVCRAARPNAAHEELCRLERRLGDRFTLITQNVDGLHVRAGNTEARSWRIHGDIGRLRCAAGCTSHVEDVPDALPLDWSRGQAVAPQHGRHLRCPSCGGWRRPHVLWLDECYDEPFYRFESSLRAAAAADALLVVGTSGSTNLPLAIVRIAWQRRIPLIVIGPDDSPFTRAAETAPSGVFVRGTAVATLPALFGDHSAV